MAARNDSEFLFFGHVLNEDGKIRRGLNRSPKRFPLPLPGDTVGRWSIIEDVGKVGKSRLCRCRCACGTEKILQVGGLTVRKHGRPNSQSCGCLRRELRLARRLASVGKTVGLWTIVRYLGSMNKKRAAFYLCRCECGNERAVAASSLYSTRKPSRSCGCLRAAVGRARFTVHGETAHRKRTPEYRAWRSMRYRCKNSVHYVERNIRVCERWERSFADFLADVGRMPRSGMQIERKDNSKGYTADNCRWATSHEQARNRSGVRMLECGGRTQCLSDWADELGMSVEGLRKRLRRLPAEQALSIPPRRAFKTPA